MNAILLEGSAPCLREVPTPKIEADEVLVSVEACGLCGSDLLKFEQGGGRATLGHEVCGRVVGKGAKAPSGLEVGDRVVVAHHVPCLECHYCRRGSPTMCRQFKETNLDPGGFSELVRVSGKHARHTVLKVPKGLDSLSASLTEPLSCCLRNVRRLGLAPGDVVGIMGMGSIGLLMAQAFLNKGLTVLGFDTDPARARTAADMGIEASDGSQAAGRIAELTSGRGLDALTFTAGSAALLAERTRWVRDGGILNLFAELRASPGAELDLKELYHREVSVVPSYSSAPEDLREALSLIASGAVAVAPLVAHTFALDQFNEAVRRVKAREILKAILIPATPPVPIEKRAAAMATLF